MLKNTGSLGADFLGTDRTGNVCLVDLQLATVAFTDKVADVFGIIGSTVHHRQKNTFNLQFGIDLSFDLVDGFEQLFQALCGKIRRLNRYQHIVGSCQRIDGQHTQGGHTVQKDEIIILFDRIQILTEDCFSAHGIYQRNF